jgi:hypothetical protein
MSIGAEFLHADHVLASHETLGWALLREETFLVQG